MTDQKDSWGEYGKLVLKELERLNKKIDELENKNNSDEIKW